MAIRSMPNACHTCMSESEPQVPERAHLWTYPYRLIVLRSLLAYTAGCIVKGCLLTGLNQDQKTVSIQKKKLQAANQPFNMSSSAVKQESLGFLVRANGPFGEFSCFMFAVRYSWVKASYPVQLMIYHATSDGGSFKVWFSCLLVLNLAEPFLYILLLLRMLADAGNTEHSGKSRCRSLRELCLVLLLFKSLTCLLFSLHVVKSGLTFKSRVGSDESYFFCQSNLQGGMILVSCQEDPHSNLEIS